MDDQPLWKKERLFERKPKEAEARVEPRRSRRSSRIDEPPRSLSSRAGSRRGDLLEEGALVQARRRLTRSRLCGRRRGADGEDRSEPGEGACRRRAGRAEETVWKKEVSFGRKVSREDAVVEAEPVVAEAATDEVAPDEQSADPPEQVSDPEPSRRRRSGRRKSRSAARRSAERSPSSPSTKSLLREPSRLRTSQRRSRSYRHSRSTPQSRRHAVELVASAEPWNAPPVMPPAPPSNLWPRACRSADAVRRRQAAGRRGRPAAAGRRGRPEGSVLEERALARRQEADRDKPVEDSRRAEGPAPSRERCSRRARLDVVHPPVAAADLPPLVGEDAPKVPFWKKELSLGGKNGDKPAKERKQKVPKVKAERVDEDEGAQGAEAGKAAEGAQAEDSESESRARQRQGHASSA